MRLILILAAALAVWPAAATELVFDFGDFTVDHTPTNFTSLVAGRGKPGDWRIMLDEVPPTLAPLTTKALAVTSRAVLAQKTREPVAAHFPILIYDGDTFNDFKFTTRFKLAGGALEQSAGIVFRFQNISNFFVMQASGLGNSFRCSKVVDGIMKPPIGPEVTITKGVWHEMSVQCEGTRITGTLDGHELVKLVDNSSAGKAGKIGFCTRADAVTCFVDARITFTPHQVLAERLVEQTLKEYSRLVDMKIFAVRPEGTTPVVIASKNARDLGQAGSQTEQDVIKTGHSYYGKGKETVTVALPLRDNNGDVIAAAWFEMKSFIGQTEDNALVRAQPIVRKLQAQVQSLEELLQ